MITRHNEAGHHQSWGADQSQGQIRGYLIPNQTSRKALCNITFPGPTAIYNIHSHGRSGESFKRCKFGIHPTDDTFNAMQC